jgi:hypothetical protein
MSRESEFLAKLIEKGPHRKRGPYSTIGDGHKGIRLQEAKRYFADAFDGAGGFVAALNELIAEKRVLAVTFEWQEARWNARKKSIKNVEKLDRVDGEGNPMLYRYENVPKPIAKALKTSADIRDHARSVLREIGN